jgi:hypothetical protein
MQPRALALCPNPPATVHTWNPKRAFSVESVFWRHSGGPQLLKEQTSLSQNRVSRMDMPAFWLAHVPATILAA